MSGVTTKVFAKDRALFSRLRALPLQQKLAMSVTAVPFVLRSQKRLAAAGIGTLGELAAKTRFDLLKLGGLGVASVDQIEAYLGELGLVLAQEAPPAPKTTREEALEGLLLEARNTIQKLTEALNGRA